MRNSTPIVLRALLIALTVFVSALVAPRHANATTILWTLHNVDFGSALPVTGTFVIDSVKGIENVDISGPFSSFDASDVNGGNPLNLTSGTYPFTDNLLLQQNYSLVTTTPSQLADNPLFGGSDEDFIFIYTLNTKDNPYISGQIIASVPEPAAWAMMLLGVGMVGAGLRVVRRKNMGLTNA